MASVFLYKTLSASGMTAKILGYKPYVTREEARLDGYREDGEGGFVTLVPDERHAVIGKTVDLSDEDIAAVDKYDETYERVIVKVGGEPCFVYVMKDIYKREEPWEAAEGEMAEQEKKEFLSKAIERFDDIVSHTENIRLEFVEDIRFKAGSQWPLSEIQARQRDSRPCLTVNRCDNFINTVVNQALQNQPAIKVRPVNDTTDPATADVISGLIRHVITQGDSKAALDQAFDDAVSGGFGFFRVNTAYCDDESFDQELRIERIENPCAVYFPFHLLQTLDFSDATYCFVRQKISNDEFDLRWPDRADKRAEWTKSGTGDRGWYDEHNTYIAEYFSIEFDEQKLYLLPDGAIVKKLPSDGVYVRERTVRAPCVHWYLITAFDILETGKFPGSRIPIIPILGKEIIIDGVKSYISLTRPMREPQKMLNFFWTAYTEAVANAPKAPFIAEEGQIKDYKELWDNANKQLSTLVYKATDLHGNMIPPPQRVAPPEVGQGITNGITFASEFMKDTTGIHDASLGMTSNERTGKAIEARANQGSLATYHFVNSYERAIRALGNLLIEVIPVIYDTPRAIRIVGEDMTDRVALLNQLHSDPANPTRLYDMKTGKYSVVVTIGPSFDTRRQETSAMLVNLMQTAPQLSMAFFDILARVNDMPGAQEIAKRARRMINQQYPGVIDDTELGTPEEQLKQQIQQMVQDIQQLMQKSEMDEQQKGMMGEMIQTLQKALKDKQDQIQATLIGKQIDASVKLQQSSDKVDIAEMQVHSGNVRHAIEQGNKSKK